MKKSSNAAIKLCRLLGIVVFVWIVWCFITANIQINTETETIEVGSRHTIVVNGEILENEKTYQDKSLQSATLFGRSVASLISVKGNVDLYKIGEYRITYKPILSMISFKKTVKVVDREAPKIELFGKNKYCLKHRTSYTEPGFKATDNYDGDITDKVRIATIKLTDGSIKYEYFVEDSSENCILVEREINHCKGAVYLTFDDGPSTENTSKILDILKEKNVKASFFLLNYDESKNEIVKRIKDEGHVIGIHGYSHNYSEVYSSVENTMDNFYKLEKHLYETIGYRTKVVRFIGGSSNTISKKYCAGVMTEAVKRLEVEGYRYFDWNVDSGDSSENAKTAEEIYKEVVNGIKPNRDNIILMHDTNAKDSTVEALENIID